MPTKGLFISFKNTQEYKSINPALVCAKALKIHGNMIKLFKGIILNYRVKRAVKMAKELSEASKRKYIVLMVAGVPKVYSKQELKNLIQRRVFKKGTTIQDLEKRAILITA
nr:MAG TPA: hypothetical protein [Caudoviricetes sp.]